MRKEFISSSYYKGLKQDIESGYRRISHALDNYLPDMSEELVKALQELGEATKTVNEIMEKEYVKSE